MSTLDVDGLLAPIDEGSPCGPSLAYDPGYLELEAMAQGTPERQVGDSTIRAEPPNWREVRSRCLELLGRTKDLRLLVHLTVAQMVMEGLPGLRDALTLLRGSLEKYWADIHPELDPDDGNDPLERMNIVSALADQALFVGPLREVPLTNSPRAGRLSLRDLAVASGELSPPVPTEENPNPQIVDSALVDAAFEDTELDELVGYAEAAGEALDQLVQIDQFLTQTVGAASAPQLDAPKRLLGEAVKEFRTRLSRRGVDGVGGAAGPSDQGEAGADQAAEPGQAPAAAPAPGEIRTREDVVRALDRICRYYETEEPSSPVPLLLRRAQRLVAKSFVDIVRDLTPGAISEIGTISGEDYESQG